jgi:hypothetical protein
MGYSCTSQCLNIFRVYTAPYGKLVGYPTHIELIRERKMQRSSNLFTSGIFRKESDCDPCPEAIRYSHQTRRHPTPKGEMEMRALEHPSILRYVGRHNRRYFRGITSLLLLHRRRRYWFRWHNKAILFH